jgi:hypothetical protein
VPFQVSAFPRRSITTQNDALVHETAFGYPVSGSIVLAADHAEPFHVKAFVMATATQNKALAQDTELMTSGVRPTGVDHREPFQVTAFPR